MNGPKGNEKNSKIVIFIPTLSGGGVERVMLQLAKGLVEKGYQIDLVVASAKGSMAQLVPENVRLIDLGVKLGKGRLFLAIFPLIHYLKATQVKMMISAMVQANIIAVLAKQFLQKPIRLVLSEHSTLSMRVTEKLTSYILPFAVSKLYPLADKVVAVSTGVADDLAAIAQVPRNNIEVIYNPVVDHHLIQDSLLPIEHPWFKSNMPPVILAVGRLVPAKDFYTLLHAFALLRKQQSVKLIVLGDGPERENLLLLAQRLNICQDIDFHGFVQNPFPIMRRADMLVLSSVFEGLPTVLIEALALGTPIVATDCPSGPKEILENGRWGILVPPKNPELLANAMKKTLDAPIKSEYLSERGFHFSVERALSEYERVLFCH